MAAPKKTTRTETDTFGPIEVPANRYWGAQTERSKHNFRIGGERMPARIVRGGLSCTLALTGAGVMAVYRRQFGVA